MEFLLAAIAIGIICMTSIIIYCIVAGRKESKHAPSVYCQFVSEKPKSSPESYEIKKIKHMNIQQTKTNINNTSSMVNEQHSYEEPSNTDGRGMVKTLHIEGFLK
ncbi:MAG: hypothetical protein IJK67_03750 [Bacilli bacterium]|nr:hypothetical protein [Bacilli bacterium]